MTSVTSAAFKLHCVDHTFENPVTTDIPTVFALKTLNLNELDSLVSLSALCCFEFFSSGFHYDENLPVVVLKQKGYCILFTEY